MMGRAREQGDVPDGRPRGPAAGGGVRSRGSASCASWSRPRSAGGSSPTGRGGDGAHAAQAAARGRRLHARVARGDARAAARDLPADAHARGPTRAASAASPPRQPRLPQDGARVALVRRCAGRAEVPAPASVEARDHGRRRHLGLGRELRPLHAAVRVRDGEPVLEGPVVGVHRRHRRGHPVLPGVRRHRRGRAPGEHRGRRRLGRRALRLRPRLRGVPRPAPARDHAQVVGDPARRRPQQLPRVPGLGRQRHPEAGPPRLLAQPRAARLLGHRRLDHLRVRAPTATASTSAATCASSSASSRPSPRADPRRSAVEEIPGPVGDARQREQLRPLAAAERMAVAPDQQCRIVGAEQRRPQDPRGRSCRPRPAATRRSPPPAR